MSEVTRIRFAKDIQKNVWPDNSFIKRSKVDEGVALNATTVEIPQSGSKPTVIVNPPTFPLIAAQRVDAKRTYDVDLLALNPIHVLDSNDVVLPYSKILDISEDHIDALRTKYADICAHAWSANIAANFISTTGESQISYLTGTTGARKLLTLNDFIDAKTKLFAMDGVSKNGIVMSMDAEMFGQLTKAGIKEFVGSDKLTTDLISKGVIGKILDIEIYQRNSNVVYDSSGVPVKKAVGAIVDAADNACISIWQPRNVRRAEGTIKTYYDRNNPLYLGTILNAAFRGGAAISANDERGVVTIVQANV